MRRRGTIRISIQHPRLSFPRRETFRVLRRVLRLESLNGLNISVVFVNHRFMRTMNKRFLGHDYSTDVIAFPLDDLFGDDAEIYVNLDRAKSQARQYGVSMREEVRRLLIHGVLHLAGYHDKTTKEQTMMTLREDALLSLLKGARGR
ncbi:MAG TPA: rRNA maturation RNase YbeY [Bacteroidota bacterium]|nr:rRNA maturation RNase YbeY [Bacteroidota bacterium]